eukprot:m.126325 g.126325  ORF g.126325 m.126325 type:complete len:222 (-) comp29196_c0_seq1:94-759(-)
MAPVFTAVHMLKMVFDVFTDIAFVPGFAVIAKRGRHFETWIGVFQLLTSICYNLCDAFDTDFFLPLEEWHKLNNIMSVTLGSFTLIYMMGNRKEARDHVLRYCSFGAIWLFQIKDKYWMDETQYTAIVPVVLFALLALKLLKGPPAYNKPKLYRGVIGIVLAAVFFHGSLNDTTDPFRVLHGLSQVAVGGALYFLFQCIPINNYKKFDDAGLPVRNTRNLP